MFNTTYQARSSSKSWYAFTNYKDEKVPTMLNILEASCTSRDSKAAVIAIDLVELLGRSRPIIYSCSRTAQHASVNQMRFNSTRQCIEAICTTV